MPRLSDNKRMRGLLLIAATVIGGVGFCSDVSASCGDYLLLSGQTKRQRLSRTVKDIPVDGVRQPLTSLDDSQHMPRHPLAPPCRGPGCRNAPDQPMQPVPEILIPAGSGERGLSRASQEKRPLRVRSEFATESASSRRGHRLRIDRPPRRNRASFVA
ncbi:MAG: hypothetical protein IID45_07210 [Planctomycetes bacterium]|nr:hypothetical protein [Planctomycetota bacterium]